MVTETLKIHNSHYTVNYQEGETEKIHLIIKLVNENLKRISDNILEQKKQRDTNSDIDTADNNDKVNVGTTTSTVDLSMLLIMLAIEQQEKLMLFDSCMEDMEYRMKKVISKLEVIKNIQ